MLHYTLKRRPSVIIVGGASCSHITIKTHNYNYYNLLTYLIASDVCVCVCLCIGNAAGELKVNQTLGIAMDSRGNHFIVSCFI